MTMPITTTASDIANPASIAWQNYVDLEHDVLPYLQYPAGYDNDNTLLQLVTDFVCQESQQLMAKPIAATQFFGRFDGWSGWNGAYIMLPYTPVLSVVEVKEWWGTNGPQILQEQTPENQVWGFNLDARTGTLTRVFPGLVQMPWFPGSRNIEITWTAGYNPVPAMFKIPALELIREWWDATQQASRSVPSRMSDGGSMNEATATYPGLSKRVRSVFYANMQVGIG